MTERNKEYKVARPVAIAAPAINNDYLALQINNGQTVDGLSCLKYITNVPTSVPLMSAGMSSYQDGFGDAWLWVNGERQGEKVLVCNCNQLHPHLLLSGATTTTVATVSISSQNPETSGAPIWTEFYVPYSS